MKENACRIKHFLVHCVKCGSLMNLFNKFYFCSKCGTCMDSKTNELLDQIPLDSFE